MSDGHILKNDIPRIVRVKLLLPNAAIPVARAPGGLSSAIVIRCVSPRGNLCLRGWPRNGPSRSRLEAIRSAVAQTHQSLQLLPRYLVDTQGGAFVQHDGRFWELTQWMPGRADYLECPSSQKLSAAMRALAALHVVWATSSTLNRSHAVAARIAFMTEAKVSFSNDDLGRLPLSAQVDSTSRLLAEQTVRALNQWGRILMDQLLSIQSHLVSAHFTLRDIWSDHVLFAGNQVTGIIDLGAARIDEPATDVARLLGSLEPFSQQKWRSGLEFYRELVPQIDPERVAILDRSSCLLSAVQWMKWLCIERKEFSIETVRLHQRWREFLDRIEAWS